MQPRRRLALARLHLGGALRDLLFQILGQLFQFFFGAAAACSASDMPISTPLPKP